MGGEKLPTQAGVNLGLRAAAKCLGVSHVALKKAADAGRVDRNPDGTFDVERVRRQLTANSHPAKQRAGRSQRKAPDAEPEAGKLSYNELLCERERVRLEKDKLDLAKRKGALVEKDAVNAWVAGMILQARDTLLQMGPTLRDKLAKVEDPVEVEALLMDQVQRALRKLAAFEN